MPVAEMGASFTLFYRYCMSKKILPSLDLLTDKIASKRI